MFPYLKILKESSQQGTLGMIDDEPCSYFFVNTEKLKFFAELSMISLSGFFQMVHVLVKLLLIRKSSSIDTLQHLVLFISAPVSTSNIG